MLAIEDAERDVVTIPDDGKLVPHSRAHKTSSSHGPATLVLEGTDAFLDETNNTE